MSPPAVHGAKMEILPSDRLLIDTDGKNLLFLFYSFFCNNHGACIAERSFVTQITYRCDVSVTRKM